MDGGGRGEPGVLPDFGTNIKNGHEERIKHHEQTEWDDAERREARAGMQNDAV